jgi:hypothetical protein
VKYTIRFIGTRIQGGKIGDIGVTLQESAGASATYVFKNDELYVRATILSSRKHPNGYATDDLESAWAQPVVVRRLTK